MKCKNTIPVISPLEDFTAAETRSLLHAGEARRSSPVNGPMAPPPSTRTPFVLGSLVLPGLIARAALNDLYHAPDFRRNGFKDRIVEWRVGS